MISAGDKIPSVTIKQATPEGGSDVDPATLFAGKKVVMFSLPGAFTPTCSSKHLPGYLAKYNELKAEGARGRCTRHRAGVRRQRDRPRCAVYQGPRGPGARAVARRAVVPRRRARRTGGRADAMFGAASRLGLSVGESAARHAMRATR